MKLSEKVDIQPHGGQSTIKIMTFLNQLSQSVITRVCVGGAIGAVGTYLWKSWRFPTIAETKAPVVCVYQELHPNLYRIQIDFKNKNLNKNIYNINLPEVEKKFATHHKMNMGEGAYYEIIYEETQNRYTMGDFHDALFLTRANIEYHTFNSINPFAKTETVKVEIDLM